MKHYCGHLVSLSTIRPCLPSPHTKLRSRRNKAGGSTNSQGNGSSNSNSKMASSTPMITSSSSSSSSLPSSSMSSSSSSVSKRGGVPFHHRPSYPALVRANTVANGKENASAVLPPGSGSVEGVQDRANRSVFSIPQRQHQR